MAIDVGMSIPFARLIRVLNRQVEAYGLTESIPAWTMAAKCAHMRLPLGSSSVALNCDISNPVRFNESSQHPLVKSRIVVHQTLQRASSIRVFCGAWDSPTLTATPDCVASLTASDSNPGLNFLRANVDPIFRFNFHPHKLDKSIREPGGVPRPLPRPEGFTKSRLSLGEAYNSLVIILLAIDIAGVENY